MRRKSEAQSPPAGPMFVFYSVYAQTNILQVAVATELNIPVSDLTATSYAEAGTDATHEC